MRIAICIMGYFAVLYHAYNNGGCVSFKAEHSMGRFNPKSNRPTLCIQIEQHQQCRFGGFVILISELNE